MAHDMGLAMNVEGRRSCDLDARLGRANEEVVRLRGSVDRSGNVVRFRLMRYLESLHEDVVDLNERSKDMPPPDTYERRKFERDLGSLGTLIAVTEAKFAAATAEEQGDIREEIRAEVRALDVQMEALQERWPHAFHRQGRAAARSRRERGTAEGSAG
ncbi:MAG TPA: hypothetical protein VFT76_05170 [Actinomycetota bacterium]|nr:hypothetical protein [Actinomycetota bacterium]